MGAGAIDDEKLLYAVLRAKKLFLSKKANVKKEYSIISGDNMFGDLALIVLLVIGSYLILPV